MDADDAKLGEFGEALAIMFTVTASGLLVIIITGTGVLLRTRRISISALLCSLLAAFWAWGLIRVKRLSYWLQRNGRSDDQTFPLMPIHLFEIASSLMLLLITLLFHIRPGRQGANLQGMVPVVTERLGSLARPPVLLSLVGLAITGYGMAVFFHGDSGVYFVTIGLVVVITGVWSSHRRDTVRHMDGVPIVVYLWCSWWPPI